MSETVEDSGLIQSLRAQIKDLNAQLKASPSRDEIEGEVRAAWTREQDIKEALAYFNHPTSGVMFDEVSKQLPEGEQVTWDAVQTALEEIGYTVEEPAAVPDFDESAAQALAAVTNLASQVQGGIEHLGPDAVISEKIQRAQTPAELAAVAREGGFLVDSSQLRS